MPFLARLLAAAEWAIVGSVTVLGRAARMFIVASLAAGCAKSAAAGSPEAVADAFCEAYFVKADQQKAKQFTAFGASKMLDQEIADTRPVREQGHLPTDASLEVAVERGARSTRADRVRFDYTVRFHEGSIKHADVELTKVEGEWKVVRIGVGAEP